MPSAVAATEKDKKLGLTGYYKMIKSKFFGGSGEPSKKAFAAAGTSDDSKCPRPQSGRRMTSRAYADMDAETSSNTLANTLERDDDTRANTLANAIDRNRGERGGGRRGGFVRGAPGDNTTLRSVGYVGGISLEAIASLPRMPAGFDAIRNHNQEAGAPEREDRGERGAYRDEQGGYPGENSGKYHREDRTPGRESYQEEREEKPR
ncbi:hypothetical protein T484DRAFT_1888625, partial [Baffinella frigidus]